MKQYILLGQLLEHTWTKCDGQNVVRKTSFRNVTIDRLSSRLVRLSKGNVIYIHQQNICKYCCFEAAPVYVNNSFMQIGIFWAKSLSLLRWWKRTPRGSRLLLSIGDSSTIENKVKLLELETLGGWGVSRWNTLFLCFKLIPHTVMLRKYSAVKKSTK